MNLTFLALLVLLIQSNLWTLTITQLSRSIHITQGVTPHWVMRYGCKSVNWSENITLCTRYSRFTTHIYHQSRLRNRYFEVTVSMKIHKDGIHVFQVIIRDFNGLLGLWWFDADCCKFEAKWIIGTMACAVNAYCPKVHSTIFSIVRGSCSR